MTAKEKLRMYRDIELDVEAKLEQRAKMRSIIRRAGKEGERANERLREAEERIQTEIETLFAMQNEVRRALDNVRDQTLRKILEYRYLNGWSLLKISRKLNMSYDWVRHLHGVALMNVRFDETFNTGRDT